MATLVFLGRLQDVAGARTAQVAVPPGATLAALLDLLDARAPGLRAALTQDGVRVAVNKALRPAGLAAPVGDGDEIAFLPPVTGG